MRVLFAQAKGDAGEAEALAEAVRAAGGEAWLDAPTATAIAQAMARRAPDVVHTFDAASARAVARALRKRDVAPAWVASAQAPRGPFSRLRARALLGADAVIVDSRAGARAVRRALPRGLARVEVIPPGVDFRRFAAAPTKRAPGALRALIIDADETAVRALALARAEGAAICAVAVGASARARRLARKLLPPEAVRFVDAVSLPAALAAVDVALCRAQGPCVEALACARLVIVADGPLARERVPVRATDGVMGGWRVRPPDAQGFARALARAQATPDGVLRWAGAEARAWAQARFDARAVSRRTLALYQSLRRTLPAR